MHYVYKYLRIIAEWDQLITEWLRKNLLIDFEVEIHIQVEVHNMIEIIII